MTTRRPPGTNFESAVEKEIRASMARGEFEALDGLGRPLSDLDDADELWWVRRKLKDEGFVQLPPSLALRRDAHAERERARHARTEAEVVEILEAINERLAAAIRIPLSGPSVYVPPYDLPKALAEWRTTHPQPIDQPEPPAADTDVSPRTQRPRLWQRRRIRF